MKRLVASVLALLLICLSFAGCGKKTDEKNHYVPSEYKLAYSDEFNGKELDENVWAKSGPEVRRGGYWSPEQVWTEGGNLIIETAYKGEDETELPGYYSGEILWKTQRTTYGYYEARCRIRDIRGVWSAFWLQPDTMGTEDGVGKASDGAEIDIFESAVTDKIQGAIHYDDYKKRKTNPVYIDNLYDRYHVYALDWKKESMTFYCDGEVIWEVTDPNLLCDTPVSMRFSTEIAGKPDKDGIPNPSVVWVGCGVIDESKEKLPARYEVDYVRVYDNGDLVLTK